MFEYYLDDSDGEATYVTNETEFLTYLHKPRSNAIDNLSELSSFPVVRHLFLKYNTPIPSSAPVERLFSFAGIIFFVLYALNM